MSLIPYMLSIETSDYMRTTNHWHRNKFKNRAEAMRDLIRTGLDASEARFAETSPDLAAQDAKAINAIRLLENTSTSGGTPQSGSPRHKSTAGESQ